VTETEDPRFDPNSEEFDPPGPDWLYRWRMRLIGHSRARQLAWKAFITFVGSAVTLAGVVMLVVPGPGWAAIFLGLAILASEYVWARRLLRFTKDRAQGAASAVLAKENRGLALAFGLVVALLIAAAVSWYLYRFGLSLDGPLGWLG
jgi:uncharacterized protein (TIGR02611 family)